LAPDINTLTHLLTRPDNRQSTRLEYSTNSTGAAKSSIRPALLLLLFITDDMHSLLFTKQIWRYCFRL